MNFDHPETFVSDELLELELRIARKADELVQLQTSTSALNLHCWLQAERAVLPAGFSDYTDQPQASLTAAQTCPICNPSPG